MKIKTSELEGAALDWAVAIAIGYRAVASGYGLCWYSGDTKVSATNAWKPSTDWSQGGPIIEREDIDLSPPCLVQDGLWYAQCWMPYAESFAPTPLIAACRAIVAAKLGDTVDVPEGLV